MYSNSNKIDLFYWGVAVDKIKKLRNFKILKDEKIIFLNYSVVGK